LVRDRRRYTGIADDKADTPAFRNTGVNPIVSAI
jgi:hypothetical protein